MNPLPMDSDSAASNAEVRRLKARLQNEQIRAETAPKVAQWKRRREPGLWRVWLVMLASGLFWLWAGYELWRTW